MTAQPRHTLLDAKAITRAVRRPRGFFVVDVMPWQLAIISILVFIGISTKRDEQEAERERAETIALAEECLSHWEDTLNDLAVCTSVREHYASLTEFEANDCNCWGEGGLARDADGRSCPCWHGTAPFGVWWMPPSRLPPE